MIELIHVSKKFRIWEDRSRDLKETTINFLKGKKRSFRDLWALRDIHVTIREGEIVAFIGRNGSGKSTLLKLLAGIYTPDEGRITTRGKISTLLELGVGFHPDLTGEENIYLNGAMLGFDESEMRERFGEIVSFSEIGDFIYSPIRTYSSGMLMRLGFSIATCVDPDILLVDEILAVGDEAFQEKCFARMEKFKEAKKTIILVSHSLDMIQKFCDRAILLHSGRIITDGSPGETIERYHHLISPKIVEKETPSLSVSISPARTEGGGGEEVLATESVSEGLGQEDLLKREDGDLSDPTQFEVLEVEDASFLAGDLFTDAFAQPPPREPFNYLWLYKDPKQSSTFQVIGFIHIGHTYEMDLGEVGFVGGVCVDSQWRGKGIEKRMLSYVDHPMRDKKALFIFTDHPMPAAECGYEALPHPYLMVKWLHPCSVEEKTRLIGAAMAFGPF